MLSWPAVPQLVVLCIVAGIGGLWVPEAGAQCRGAGEDPGSVTLLVDASASLAEHDAGGALRSGVAAGLEASAPGATVDVALFDAGLRAQTSSGPGRPVAQAFEGLLRADGGGDRGGTDPALAFAELAASGSRPEVAVLVTDAEPAAAIRLPGELTGTRLVVATLGGDPPAKLRELAINSGGWARGVRSVEGATQLGRDARTPAGCGTAAPSAAVVLVSGLRTQGGEVRGARTVSACRPADGLAAWCRALVARGARVWVPSIGRGRRGPGGGRALLDSKGRVRDNAGRLAGWVRAEVPGRPIYVGHSMGGLIAHAAISWAGAPAAGLITVGTPHAGSFGADAYRAALLAAAACWARCPALAVSFSAQAAALRAHFGAALLDLTREQRQHIDPLPGLGSGVPVAAYAGAVNTGPTGVTALLLRASRAARAPVAGGRYLFPNDSLVGVGSALDLDGPLSPRITVQDGRERHSVNVPPVGAPTELSSPATAAFILTAIQQLMGAGAQMAAPRSVGLARRSAQPEWSRPRAGVPRPRRRVAPARISVPLSRVLPLDGFGPGAPLPDAGAMVVSTQPISLLCDGASVDALPVSAGLYVLDLAALGCTAAALDPAPLPLAGGSGQPPEAVAVGSPEWSGAGEGAAHVELLRRSRGSWRITVVGVPGRPKVRAGNAAVRMHRWRGSPTVSAELPALDPGGRSYRGSVGPRGAARAGAVTVTGRLADGSLVGATVALG